ACCLNTPSIRVHLGSGSATVAAASGCRGNSRTRGAALSSLSGRPPAPLTPDEGAPDIGPLDAEPPAPAGVAEVPREASRIPDALAALRYRDFQLLLLGLFLALTGWWMMIVAQGWLVLELTDSASM